MMTVSENDDSFGYFEKRKSSHQNPWNVANFYSITVIQVREALFRQNQDNQSISSPTTTLFEKIFELKRYGTQCWHLFYFQPSKLKLVKNLAFKVEALDEILFWMIE